MKKICMLVIALAMLALTACGGTTSTTEVITPPAGSAGFLDYEKYNIMSFETVDMYFDAGFAHAKIKGTNNSDKALESVSVDATFRDAEGNALLITYPQYNAPVGPGAFYIDEATMDENDYGFEDMVSADVPSYYIKFSEPDESGYMFFHVDTVNKTVEAIY